MADDRANCQEKYQGNTSALNHSSPGSVLSKAFFISGVTLASIVGGFGFAIGQARRRGPEPFDVRTQEGVKLAIKALGYGTVLAISGVGLLILGVKTALGVKDVRQPLIPHSCNLTLHRACT